MHRRVINPRANALGNIVAVTLRLGPLPEVLLLIANEMFCARDHPRTLDSLDCLGNQNPG